MKKIKDWTRHYFNILVSNTGKFTDDEINKMCELIHSWVVKQAEENNLEVSFEKHNCDYYYFIFGRKVENRQHYSPRFKYPLDKEILSRGYKQFDDFIVARQKAEKRYPWDVYVLGKMN